MAKKKENKLTLIESDREYVSLKTEEKRMKKNVQSLRKLQGALKNKMHTMRVLEREERETNIKNIRRDDTLKNSFNLRENINLQIQGAQ